MNTTRVEVFQPDDRRNLQGRTSSLQEEQIGGNLTMPNLLTTERKSLVALNSSRSLSKLENFLTRFPKNSKTKCHGYANEIGRSKEATEFLRKQIRGRCMAKPEYLDKNFGNDEDDIGIPVQEVLALYKELHEIESVQFRKLTEFFRIANSKHSFEKSEKKVRKLLLVELAKQMLDVNAFEDDPESLLGDSTEYDEVVIELQEESQSRECGCIPSDDERLYSVLSDTVGLTEEQSFCSSRQFHKSLELMLQRKLDKFVEDPIGNSGWSGGSMIEALEHFIQESNLSDKIEQCLWEARNLKQLCRFLDPRKTKSKKHVDSLTAFSLTDQVALQFPKIDFGPKDTWATVADTLAKPLFIPWEKGTMSYLIPALLKSRCEKTSGFRSRSLEPREIIIAAKEVLKQLYAIKALWIKGEANLNPSRDVLDDCEAKEGEVKLILEAMVKQARNDPGGSIDAREVELEVMRISYRQSPRTSDENLSVQTTGKANRARDIRDAIRAHLAWKHNFELAISDPSSIELPGAERIKKDDECAFGKWLHGEGDCHDKDSPLKELHDAHETFHLWASRIRSLVQQGENKSALLMIKEELTPRSIAVVKLLEQIEADPK